MEKINRKQIKDLIKTSNVFCILPFKHMLLEPSGQVSVCCMSFGNVINDNNRPIEWDKVKFNNELWEGSFYKKLRTNMIKGVKTDVCKRCYGHEDTGSFSYRNGQNQRFLDNITERSKIEIKSINVVTGNNYKHPTDWDIRFSRLCNLKCRMCDSGSSSQIHKEGNEHPQLQKFRGHADPVTDKYNYDEKDATYVLKTLPRVDRLKILGGEPTLDPQVQIVLDEAIRIGRDDIYLDITTNLTNVTDRWLESLGRFKDVQLQFSIDGYDKTNEYIRSASRWPQVEENIRRYLNFKAETDTNWMLSFHQTVSIYNIFDFWKVHEWVESLRAEDKFERLEQNSYHTDIIHTPPDLDPHILPIPYRAFILRNFNKYKPKITQNLATIGIESIITLLERHAQPENANELLQVCKERTDAVDKVRGAYIKDYILDWRI